VRTGAASTDRDDDDDDDGNDDGDNGDNNVVDEDLATLHDMFPEMRERVLRGHLAGAGGDVEIAIEWLLARQAGEPVFDFDDDGSDDDCNNGNGDNGDNNNPTTVPQPSITLENVYSMWGNTSHQEGGKSREEVLAQRALVDRYGFVPKPALDGEAARKKGGRKGRKDFYTSAPDNGIRFRDNVPIRTTQKFIIEKPEESDALKATHIKLTVITKGKRGK
jgi:hypothetical protein